MNTIVWADDEIDLLKPYIIYLSSKGYEIIPAMSGQDAIEACKQHVVDIVFLDEQMPGLSGIETLQILKQEHPELPIVMITKSEEEQIMEQAIGQQIADYLIKPVNPSQILLCLKKHVHSRQIVEEHTNANYRQEFSDITYMINTARTFDEFAAIERTLTQWELKLQDANSSMAELLSMQRKEANAAFAKFVRQNYEQWFEHPESRPIISTDVFRKAVFPLLDEGRKVFVVVIDNFRYSQWKIIQPLLAEYFSVKEEQLYSAILPTATQYARNAIFAGLMPLQIQQQFPEYWVEEGDEETKNKFERELVGTMLHRFRRRDEYSYFKINESDFCEKVIRQLKSLSTPLNIAVVNFIDMLSHSRTDSKMMRELAPDEAAYHSLTLSWFKHSPIMEFFHQVAALGYEVVLTTDHGTIRVTDPVQIVADKNTNTNLRYKVGKSLSFQDRSIFELTKPAKVGLPAPNLSSTYAFCTGNLFFGYPNNFNYYAQYYRDTFQHGGISMEEMIIPLVHLQPK
ncbi:MAG: PglZ domain-containing protein [Paludibacteraceae bacterium]|nr:PglZ domain-containing protein [Paludibacteraceae bacterium]